MKGRLSKAIERRWYGKAGILNLFLPLESCFRYLANKRRVKQQSHAQAFPIPVIIVGNINVGGVGKTPCLVALVEHLQGEGLRAGVVSRGYGRNSEGLYILEPGSDKSLSEDAATFVGDEPLLIHRRTGAPVAVCNERVLATQALVNTGVDVILADDGLQHYHLWRDLELVVVDGKRGFGNERVLPIGPLREPISRLAEVDYVLVNSNDRDVSEKLFSRIPEGPHRSVVNTRSIGFHAMAASSFKRSCFPLNHFARKGALSKPAVAMAGIGQPEKFFSELKALGIQCEYRAFDDHHDFSETDFDDLDDKIVFMTEKDAVKCAHLVRGEAYYLEIEMALQESFLLSFGQQVRRLIEAKTKLNNNIKKIS